MKYQGSPRMEDIARLAGVSKSTVSRALRNSASISEAVRRRIAAIAQEVGYRQNPLVSALMTRVRTGHPSASRPGIAFIFLHSGPTELSRIYREFWNGARTRSHALGYGLHPFWPVRDQVTFSRVAEILHARGIRGLILGPREQSVTRNPDVYRPLWETFSVAVLGASLPGVSLHRSTNHQFSSALLGLNKLRDLGYRRPALVDSYVLDRHLGFQLSGAAEAFRMQQRPESNPRPWVESPLDPDAFLRWFACEAPDAILTSCSDLCGWLEKAGKRIPRDVGLAFFSTRPAERRAGLDQNSRHIGSAAVDLVVGQLQRNEVGIQAHPKSVFLNATWVDGPTAPGRPAPRAASRKRARKSE